MKERSRARWSSRPAMCVSICVVKSVQRRPACRVRYGLMSCFCSALAIRPLIWSFGDVGAGLKREIQFFHGGGEVTLGGGDARDFAVRVPLVGALLDVDLEDGEAFVLFFLELEAAAVGVELDSRRRSREPWLSWRRLLLFCLGLQGFRDLVSRLSKRSSARIERSSHCMAWSRFSPVSRSHSAASS